MRAALTLDGKADSAVHSDRKKFFTTMEALEDSGQ
jgi:hypothetical protein